MDGRRPLTLLLIISLLCTSCQAENQVDSLVRQLLSNYSKASPPKSDDSTEVQIGIYVNSFHSISEQHMEYAVSMYLRQAWHDPRLKFTPPIDENGKEIRKIHLEQRDAVDKIWLPDTFFRNEKSATFHDITVPNRLLTLSSEGKLWYVLKISAVLSCPMKLQKFPLDTQHCPIMFESYGHTMDTLYFTWLPSPVDIDTNVQLPQFTLKDKILYDCSQNYTAGAFPCLEIQFVLRRDIGFFIMQVYMPSMLIVALSWITFWLSASSVSARVLLSLLCAVALVLQSTWVSSSLARVSYIKAIDVWFSVCLVLVVCSLLELGVIHLLSRRRERSARGQSDVELKKAGEASPDSSPQGVQGGKVDSVCRIVFPIVFVVFNIIYWSIYQ